MVLKTLIIAALLYFAFRAVQNMLRAMVHDQQQRPLHSSRPTRPTAAAPPSRPARVRRREPDIEDAKWEDL